MGANISQKKIAIAVKEKIEEMEAIENPTARESLHLVEIKKIYDETFKIYITS